LYNAYIQRVPEVATKVSLISKVSFPTFLRYQLLGSTWYRFLSIKSVGINDVNTRKAQHKPDSGQDRWPCSLP